MVDQHPSKKSFFLPCALDTSRRNYLHLDSSLKRKKKN